MEADLPIRTADRAIYLLTVKAGIGLALAITCVLVLVGAPVAEDLRRLVIDSALQFGAQAAIVFTWTTLAFAALDLLCQRAVEINRWDPVRLPALPPRRLCTVPVLRDLLGAVAVLCARRQPAPPAPAGDVGGSAS